MPVHRHQSAKRDPVCRVTTSIVHRATQHRDGSVDGFTKRYGLKRLVHVEQHQTIAGAIQRESTIKHWPRAWKIKLIEDENPAWADLYESLL